MNYGRAIRIAMGAADVRGTDLARAIGMSPSSISLVCMGRRGISLDKLDLIAKVFDMPRFVLDLLAEGPEQERMEAWIVNEVNNGAQLPGLYPMNADTKARYAASKK